MSIQPHAPCPSCAFRCVATTHIILPPCPERDFAGNDFDLPRACRSWVAKRWSGFPSWRHDFREHQRLGWIAVSVSGISCIFYLMDGANRSNGPCVAVLRPLNPAAQKGQLTLQPVFSHHSASETVAKYSMQKYIRRIGKDEWGSQTYMRANLNHFFGRGTGSSGLLDARSRCLFIVLRPCRTSTQAQPLRH